MPYKIGKKVSFTTQMKNMKKIERYEVYNIDPKVKMKVKLYCVKNDITAAEFMNLAIKALSNKE